MRSPWLPAWLLHHAAETLSHRHEWQQADNVYLEAVHQPNGSGPALRMLLLEAWASSFWYRGDRENAEKYFLLAQNESQRLSNGDLFTARYLNYLGTLVAWDPVKAGEYYVQALKIHRKLAPASTELLMDLNGLGRIAYESGDFLRAETYYREILVVAKQNAGPTGRLRSYQVGSALNAFGLMSLKRGDPATAEKYLRETLSIWKRVDPSGQLAANAIGNLGVVALQQGNSAQAETYYRQSMAIIKRLKPDSADVCRGAY